jgi:hypothetical protein
VTSSLDSLQDQAKSEPLLLAGNCLSPAMIASLATSKPQAVTPLRTVALGSGDEAIGGTPLWLRAEPGEDAAMAEAMAADIAAWSRTCGIS